MAGKHQILNQKASSSGKFTFTSTEPGQHTICLSIDNLGWFNHPKFVILNLIVREFIWMFPLAILMKKRMAKVPLQWIVTSMFIFSLGSTCTRVGWYELD